MDVNILKNLSFKRDLTILKQGLKDIFHGKFTYQNGLIFFFLIASTLICGLLSTKFPVSISGYYLGISIFSILLNILFLAFVFKKVARLVRETFAFFGYLAHSFPHPILVTINLSAIFVTIFLKGKSTFFSILHWSFLSLFFAYFIFVLLKKFPEFKERVQKHRDSFKDKLEEIHKKD